jgi:hypothetical protein
MPVSGAFLNISSRVPSKGTLHPQRPFILSLLEERRFIPRASFINMSESLVDDARPRFPSGAPVERDARLQSFSYLSFSVPSKGALPPGSLHRALIDSEYCVTVIYTPRSQFIFYVRRISYQNFAFHASTEKGKVHT